MRENKLVRDVRPAAPRAGQALVEFAIISFVLSAIVAGLLGIMVLGLGSFQNNIATENAGRILDQHDELTEANFITHFGLDPQEFSIDQATAEQVYQFLTDFTMAYGANDEIGMSLYDERLLILTPSRWRHLTDPDNPDNKKEVPEINRSLLPAYIYDPDVTVDGETGAFRYPGAVVQRTIEGETYQTVLIPILDATLSGQSIQGVERTFNIDSNALANAHPASQNWVAPVTVVKGTSSSEATEAYFKIVLFYPSQPGSMVRVKAVRGEDNKTVSQTLVAADDDSLESQLRDLPDGYALSPPTVNPAFDVSSSRGEYGLGESYAFLTKVRPYRRVFESASLFRLKSDRLLAKYAFSGEVEHPFIVGQTVTVSQGLDSGTQVLKFLNPLIERNFVTSSDAAPHPTLRLVGPPSDVSNGQEYQLTVPQSGEGTWRVVIMAEVEPQAGYNWGHEYDLKLLLRDADGDEQLVAAERVTANYPGDSNPIQLFGQAVFVASPGDVFQACVDTKAIETGTVTEPETDSDTKTEKYKLQLTGNAGRNWVTYEFLGAQ